jgi:hypothetical protein
MDPATGTECLNEETVAAFVTGALDPEDLLRAEAHLADCRACGHLVASAGRGVLESTRRSPSIPQRARGTQRESGEAAEWLRPGEVLAGKYRVEALIGRGAMGHVFSASHIELGHRVAIKVLRRDDASAGARFLLEAQTCAHLRTDHVARVFDLGRLPGGAPYIVMEYLVGEDLAHVIARGPVDASRAATYASQVCLALAEAHARGIIHRDLKPANLFLTTRDDGSPRVKVLDFGISRFKATDDFEGHAITSTGTVVGTPLYMSPEQLLARGDVDARSDIWSLGVVLFELLTGSPPFRGQTLPALTVAIVTEAPSWPSSMRDDVPPGLEAVVMKSLEKDRAARFASARELMDALTPFGTSSPAISQAPPAPPGTRFTPLARLGKARAILAGTSAVLVGACVIAPFLTRKRAPREIHTGASEAEGRGAPGAGACFDVGACFADFLLTVPIFDPTAGCIVNKMEGGASVNVALVVNTARQGNVGVCGPAGCLIALDRDPVTGWEPLAGVGIRLPPAVCRDMGHTLQSVALTTSCPTKSARTTTCPAPSTCVASNVTCPATWSGYSCSGTATPQTINPQLLGCWRVPEDEDAGISTGPGERWCCTIGQAPSKDPLLIDDMSNGPEAKLTPPAGYIGGWWWASSDVPHAPISPPPLPLLFTYTSITPPVVPTKGGPTIQNAACLRSKGFSGWIAMEGLDFVEPARQVSTTEPCSPFDLSSYSGIRFWAASRNGDQPIMVAFPNIDTATEIAEATCRNPDAGGRCGDDWAIQDLPLTTAWTEYAVKWSDLKQSSIKWGAQFPSFDSKHVVNVWFGVRGPGPTGTSPPFDFCVSDIHFTR